MTELEQGVWCAAFALAFRDAEGPEIAIIPGDIDIAEVRKMRLNVVVETPLMTVGVDAALCSAAADRAVEALRRLDK